MKYPRAFVTGVATVTAGGFGGAVITFTDSPQPLRWWNLSDTAGELERAPDQTTATAEDWLLAAKRRIDVLRQLGPGWNGDGSVGPNFTAVEHARGILELLHEQNVPPSRVVPAADGGIGLYFFGSRKLAGGAHTRFASLTCYNPGEISLLLTDRISGRVETREIASDYDSIHDAVETLDSFVRS